MRDSDETPESFSARFSNERSARRPTVRTRCAYAEARDPPGKMKSLSIGKSALSDSVNASSRAICATFMAKYPGIDISPPRSNKSCCTSVNASRSGSGIASVSNRPTTQFSSSISPIAATRGCVFGTREPSPRPVEPASPVFVVILVKRWPIK